MDQTWKTYVILIRGDYQDHTSGMIEEVEIPESGSVFVLFNETIGGEMLCEDLRPATEEEFLLHKLTL